MQHLRQLHLECRKLRMLAVYGILVNWNHWRSVRIFRLNIWFRYVDGTGMASIALF